ncbi:hypothetical protein [Actinoplanes sp. NPDC026619]|uniref:hypothetical protein n=1 Tax=Actinoplanes sp. NPDC026619 TaxID=3155798 RepID=UPI00340B443A
MDDVASADFADHPAIAATTAAPQSLDTLAYPISPEYVKSWTLTCICQAKWLVKQLTIFQACEARILGVRCQ